MLTLPGAHTPTGHQATISRNRSHALQRETNRPTKLVRGVVPATDLSMAVTEHTTHNTHTLSVSSQTLQLQNEQTDQLVRTLVPATDLSTAVKVHTHTHFA